MLTPEQEAEQKKIWAEQDELDRKWRDREISREQFDEEDKRLKTWLKRFQNGVIGRRSDGLGNGV